MTAAPMSGASAAAVDPTGLAGTTDPKDMSLPYYGAGFMTALKRFFRGYAQFTGRASRSEYWWAQLWMVILIAIPIIILYAGLIPALIWSDQHATEVPGLSDPSGDPYTTGPDATQAPTFFLFIIGLILLGIVILALILPSISIEVRRLHDGGFSGLFYLLNLVGLSIVPFILTFLPPKPEGRRFDR